MAAEKEANLEGTFYIAPAPAFKHGVYLTKCILRIILREYIKCTNLGLTSETGTFRRAAMSSTVSLPSEMIPTPLAMALAVMGWSPVTMIT